MNRKLRPHSSNPQAPPAAAGLQAVCLCGHTILITTIAVTHPANTQSWQDTIHFTSALCLQWCLWASRVSELMLAHALHPGVQGNWQLCCLSRLFSSNSGIVSPIPTTRTGSLHCRMLSWQNAIYMLASLACCSPCIPCVLTHLNWPVVDS